MSDAQDGESVDDWRRFLVDAPPGARVRVRGAAYAERHPVSTTVHMPELQLWCDGRCASLSFCSGSNGANGRLFGGMQLDALKLNSGDPVTNVPHDVVIRYACEACTRVVKCYFLRFWTVAPTRNDIVDVEKIAEWPRFAPRTPGKVMSLVGPDRELFLKGRRAEIEGLGIGAFSYYRRIVEGQKNRLLDEIIRVARHVSADPELITTLEAAKSETQFSKAVESVKDAIPPVLHIKGYNPLTLLHSALSEGIHAASDEECLRAANDIRLMLIEFAARLSDAMKEQKELDEALNRLANRKK